MDDKQELKFKQMTEPPVEKLILKLARWVWCFP